MSTISRRLRVRSSCDGARIQSMGISWVAGLVCLAVRKGGIQKRHNVEGLHGQQPCYHGTFGTEQQVCGLAGTRLYGRTLATGCARISAIGAKRTFIVGAARSFQRKYYPAYRRPPWSSPVATAELNWTRHINIYKIWVVHTPFSTNSRSPRSRATSSDLRKAPAKPISSRARSRMAFAPSPVPRRTVARSDIERGAARR